MIRITNLQLFRKIDNVFNNWQLFFYLTLVYSLIKTKEKQKAQANFTKKYYSK